MKHIMTAVFMLLATFGSLNCQSSYAQTPSVHSDNHAMLRLDASQHYLLLPVQEAEENAHVRVIVDNQEIKNFNTRLAVSKTDYRVPFDMSPYAGKSVLLDITFNGNRHQKGALKDYVCWNEMQCTDTFDDSNTERFRPAYHHTPRYGWMNDPNGMFYKDGTWHLYYQYNPYGSQWENMTWGHSTSTDLVYWTPQPTAIEPDALGAIFSGSCVVDKNNTAGFGKDAVVAFYTSAAASQTQSMAYSTDGGQTFKKFDKNPILTADIPDFRDPNVFWYEPTQRWILILAAGQEMNIYSSPDLKQWQYESSFGKEYGNHGGVWECPDLFKVPLSSPLGGKAGASNRPTEGSKWVLLCNINPGGPFGGSATQYFVGSFDGHQFTCESSPKVTKWMDYGKDHYATVSFSNAPDGRVVALPWMSNWQYANQVPTRQFRSANGIARDLGLFTFNGETYLSSVPAREMLAARGKKLSKLSPTCEVVVDLKSSAQITLSNQKGEQLTMTYDAPANTFTMDRTKSGDGSFSDAFPAKTTAPTYGQIGQLRIFIDRCSVEAFDAQGKMAMTNLVFPSEPFTTLKVSGGKSTIYEIK